MKLSFEITEQDYIDFNMTHFDTSKTIRNSYRKSYISGAVLLFALPFVIPPPVEGYLILWRGLLWGSAVLWLLFYTKLLKNRFRQNILKMLREKDNSFLGQKELELREDGILTSSSASETLTAYSGINDIIEGPTGIYLYNSAFSAIMVPKRAFADERQKKEFIEFVKPRIVQKAMPAKKSLLDRLD